MKPLKLAGGLTVLGMMFGQVVADEPRQQTLVFECSNGGFVTQLVDDSAWVFLPGETVSLPRVISASGEKFGDDGGHLWLKGQEAMLDYGGQYFRHCRNNPALAVWESAKLRGMDFRATGNEPGWYLEMAAADDGTGQNLLFVGDYGERKLTFNGAGLSEYPSERRSVIDGQNGRVSIRMELLGEPCVDSMSGERFETRVSINIDGSKYEGCGRALH